MSRLNDLAITATNSAMTSAMGAMFNTLQSKIANGGRDRNCKFYYNDGAGGSILQVAVKGVVGGAVPYLKDDLENAFNSLLHKKEDMNGIGKAWSTYHQDKNRKDNDNYGAMDTEDGHVVLALDDWGCKCSDALMLGIMTDKKITVKQQRITISSSKTTRKSGLLYKIETEKYDSGEKVIDLTEFTTHMLVWYDTTAIVTINSDKNLITTRVQGRDYSRKELISNGDIKLSVSGQITSKHPDVYPTEEVRKFIKVMQYKGIIKTNNQILDQFGIEYIVITNFNLTPREGCKSVQPYSFSAIGLQPEREIEIKTDTIEVIPQQEQSKNKKDNDSGWMKMLNNQLDGLKSMAADVFSQGVGLAAGMLENKL